MGRSYFILDKFSHPDNCNPENRAKCLRVGVRQEMSYNRFCMLRPLNVVVRHGYWKASAQSFRFVSRQNFVPKRSVKCNREQDRSKLVESAGTPAI